MVLAWMLHILSQFVCFFWAICEDQGHFERLTLSKHETCDILPFFELSLFLNTWQSPICRCGWKKKKPWKWLSTPQFRKSMGVVRKTIQQRWDDATLMQPQLAKKGSLFLKKIFIFTNMMGDLYKPNIQNYDYITVYNNWISKWCLKSKYLTSKQQYC